MVYNVRFVLRNDFSPVATHGLVPCSTIFYDTKNFFTSRNLGSDKYRDEKKPAPEHRFLPTDERRKAVRVFYTLISGLLPDGSALA
jgi:hypothetical protein